MLQCYQGLHQHEFKQSTIFKVVVESLFSFAEDETPLQVMYV